MADGAIANRYEIQTIRPIQISEDTILSQDEIFDAFRQSMRDQPVSPLHDQNGKPFGAKMSVETDGTGLLKTAKQKIRFENAGLLSANPAQRRELLEQCLTEHTVAVRFQSELKELVAQPGISNEEFLSIVTLLTSSPESFAREFRQKMDTGPIAQTDLLPEDARHWDNLLAPVEGSVSLAEFLEDELATERRAHLASSPQQAMQAISLAFCAPGLVPLATLRELDTGTILAMVEAAVDLDDHFSLTGAFEICADWIERDARFVPVGERLLQRLFGEMAGLSTSCVKFAAAFTVAVAHLARHETQRTKPAFWRRLTGAAHASLVVRASGHTEIDENKLVSWAMRVAGKPYFLSVFFDMHKEPRWRPDWINPDFLMADTIGRVKNAMSRLPETTAPPEWKASFDNALTWIEEKKIEPLQVFPAIGESAHFSEQPTLAELKGDLADTYSGFAEQSSLDYLVRLAPLVFTFGFPTELDDAVLAFLDTLRREISSVEESKVKLALATVAHIAVQHRNTSLSDAVANICLENTGGITDAWTAIDVMSRLVECAAAHPNPAEAQATLMRRLEDLAFLLPPLALPEFLDGIDALQSLGDDFALGLGRARAAARLGITPDVA